MELNERSIEKIDEIMSFARILVTFVIGIAILAFSGFATSDYGKQFFDFRILSVFFNFFGFALVINSIILLFYDLYYLKKHGSFAFSAASALSRTRKELELLVALHFNSKTGTEIPDIIMEKVKKNPDLLPLFEDLLSEFPIANGKDKSGA